MILQNHKSLTYRVSLPGGQERLRELILYVAKRCDNAPRLGGIKLNKILWKADFDSFASRGVPVSGRAYQRLEFGPAPVDMAPLHAEMARDGQVEVVQIDVGDGLVEHRTRALVEPRLNWFTAEDLKFVDEAIAYYWDKTGTQASEDSNGVAWRTRANGDPMPYELAYLSDRKVGEAQGERILALAGEHGWRSQ